MSFLFYLLIPFLAAVGFVCLIWLLVFTIVLIDECNRYFKPKSLSIVDMLKKHREAARHTISDLIDD